MSAHYVDMSSATVIHKHTRKCSGKNQKQQQKQQEKTLILEWFQ